MFYFESTKRKRKQSISLLLVIALIFSSLYIYTPKIQAKQVNEPDIGHDVWNEGAADNYLFEGKYLYPEHLDGDGYNGVAYFKLTSQGGGYYGFNGVRTDILKTNDDQEGISSALKMYQYDGEDWKLLDHHKTMVETEYAAPGETFYLKAVTEELYNISEGESVE